MTIPVPLMLEHRGSFVELISRHFPLPAGTIASHANRLDWSALSRNEQLDWSATLFETHDRRWHCNELPRAALRAIGFERLLALVRAGRASASRLPLAIVDRPTFERCVDYYRAERSNHAHELFTLDWPPDAADWIAAALSDGPIGLWELSGSSDFPWTAYFIDTYADLLDWSALSENSGLPWSLELIRRFESRWDWDRLCSPPPWGLVGEHEPWTVATLDEFHDRIDWYGGASALVDNIVWTPDLFERHRAAIEAAPDVHTAPNGVHYWTYAIAHRHFTAEFVEHLLAVERQLGLRTVNWITLAATGERAWTDEFITRHRLRLPARALFGNPAFAWRRHGGTFEPNAQKLADIVAAQAHVLPPDRVAAHNKPIPALFERNPALTVEHVIWMRGWKSRGLVEFSRIAYRAGLALDTRVSDVPARLAAALDLDTVEAFLRALARLGERRNHELESTIASNPEALDAYAVYADWLESQGNSSHAELLRMLDDPSRCSTLQHYLAYGLQLNNAAWQRGFVQKAELGADWRDRLTQSPFGLLEALRIAAQRFEVDDTLADGRASIVEEDDWALLATLPRLRRLALTDIRIASTRGLARLPALTDLDLSGVSLSCDDLDDLADAPNLRRLCLAASPGLHDLGPIAKLSELVWLSLYGTAVEDLTPLRACSRLAELDLRHTRVSDVSVLESFERLRTVHLHANDAVNAAAITRLRRANPRVRIEYGGNPFAKPEAYDGWFWGTTKLRLK